MKAPRPVKVLPSRMVRSIAEDVLDGLFDQPRQLPPKYFYDSTGSRLFDAICQTPEYYPTRTETALLARHASEIVRLARPELIVELGSGSGAKTGQLFQACEALDMEVAYAPFDVCEEVLDESRVALQRQFPWLAVEPLVGDFTAGLDNVPLRAGRKLLLFLGGTIGNFLDADARRFLGEVRGLMEVGDYLLLGADRVKAPELLHAAYNDGAGVTAQFNLNVLSVLNAELDSDFILSNFEHRASYNAAAQQVEMYLDSRVDQRVGFRRLGRTLSLQAGDSILTEISRKFSETSLQALVADAGLRIERHYQSAQPLFSLVLAARADN